MSGGVGVSMRVLRERHAVEKSQKGGGKTYRAILGWETECH